MGDPIKVALAGQQSLEWAQRLLGDPEKYRKALQSANQRAASFIRTNSARFIRRRYAVPAAIAKAAADVSIYFSGHGGGHQANIDFKGRRIPLYRYSGAAPAAPTQDVGRNVRALVHGNWRIVHPSVPAYGHQLKGTSAEIFHNAFVARMKNGHTGIFQRTGGVTDQESHAIEEIMGSSVPQMLGAEDVFDAVAREVSEKFDGWLEHEVNAFLNGYR
ncbi:MAG: hypothetical protein HFH26_12575 [Clostridiaceae bacterium]|nr:hypothetical protein [Clostridiaceae bacterium]